MSMFGTGILRGIAGNAHNTHNNSSVQERYTDATRLAILHAQQECRQRGDTTVSVADLLSGLSVEEETRAERVGGLKANGFYLRWLIGLPALPALEARSQATVDLYSLDENRLTLDDDAQRAFSFAVAEADRDHEYWIDSDHLLRGLLRFPNKAHFAVLKTELTLSQMRTRSRKDREVRLPEETPNLKVIQYLVRKHAALWLPPVIGLACYLYILIQGVPLIGK